MRAGTVTEGDRRVWSRWTGRLAAAGPEIALAVLGLLLYSRFPGHHFLTNWDDSIYITGNGAIREFSAENLRTIFSTYYAGNYAPVHLLSHMLDYRIWGLWAGGYLLGNILLHIGNTLLVYRLLLAWHGERLLAAVAGVLFLCHPVQVESVYWISQRKNVLAMMFFLLAWYGYDRYRRAGDGQGRVAYGCSVAAFLLAVLTKSVVVILPVVLLLFDCCFPAGRVRWRDKIPYLLVALAAAGMALHSQTPDAGVWGAGGGRAVGFYGGSPLGTLYTMMPVFCRYLGLLVWPAGLSAEYDPPIHPTPDGSVAAAMVVMALLCWGACRLFRYDRRLGFWPLYAFLGLLPVAQIVPLVTLMNDRYLYFPMVGVAALVGAAVVRLRDRFPAGWRFLVAVPLLAMLGVTWQRQEVWHDQVTLWRDAAQQSPHRSSVWERLGEACHYGEAPCYDEAIVAYGRAIAINPASDISRYNLGVLYSDLGRYDQARSTLEALLSRNPNNVMGWAALGDVHTFLGEYDAAERAYRRANALQPEAVQVLLLLGNLAVKRERFSEAAGYFRAADQREGDNPETAFRLASLAARQGDLDGALVWLDRALQRGYDDYDELQSDAGLVRIWQDLRVQRLMETHFPDRR